MGRKNDSALFFTCSLIEQLGRTLHKSRSDIAAELGDAGLRAIYDHADVLHCEPIEKVADDAIGEFGLTAGSYDNVGQARYAVPDVWTMGVYSSWIDERLSDYNSAFYYQPRDYLAECCRQGIVLDG